MESENCSKKSTKMLEEEEEEEEDNKLADNYQKASFLEANIELSKVINGARVSLLHPTAQTPEKNKEEVAAVLDVDSPLTWDSCQQQQQQDFDLSPRTPKDYVFNSFAPGPDDLMLAPQGKRFTNQSQINVVRRLNFDSSAFDECKNEIFKENDVEVEEVLLDKMYKSILDVIESTQPVVGDDKVNEGGVIVENLSDLSGFTTPTKLPLLNGIAETCPDAPLKSKQSCHKIDFGLCKKLDFFAD